MNTNSGSGAVNKNLKVLIADDEPDILEILSYQLNKEGYIVYTALDGLDCLQKAEKYNPHLILLDVMMPNLDGIETCRQLRLDRKFDNTLIVFLSARSEEYSQLAGYGVGGNDYVTKPVKPRVIIAKVNALLTRQAPSADSEDIIEAGKLIIDKSRYTVSISGNEVSLPRREFELLSFLAGNPGRVFNREEILKMVWQDESLVGSRTIDVHIRKLRERIGASVIKTIKGVGYKFERPGGYGV